MVTMVCLVSKTLLAPNVVARLFLGYSGWLPVVCYAIKSSSSQVELYCHSTTCVDI